MYFNIPKFSQVYNINNVSVLNNIWIIFSALNFLKNQQRPRFLGCLISASD